MNRLRWPLLVASLLVSFSLAYFLRGVIYDLVVVPLAYLLWLGKIYYTAIPQAVFWVLLMVILAVALVRNIVLEVQPSPRKLHPLKQREGQVEALAVWIRKSRSGTFSKWQLANRLGRIARRVNGYPNQLDSVNGFKYPISEYLDAGLNHSFVDFPAPGHRFQRRVTTPLDLDPNIVVDYLEGFMETGRGSHP